MVVTKRRNIATQKKKRRNIAPKRLTHESLTLSMMMMKTMWFIYEFGLFMFLLHDWFRFFNECLVYD